MGDIQRLALQGLGVAFTTALVVVPLCALLANRLGVVDKPGGRKRHTRVTPLLGGVGVFVAVTAGWMAVVTQAEGVFDLDPGALRPIFTAAAIMFLVGLVDDVFKDSMAFQPKLLGQIAGVMVIMWPHLVALVETGGSVGGWGYQLFFLCWYLTVVNSLNFSDNMNGLMSGLSVIAFAAAVVYLGNEGSERTMLVAATLVGALIGFLPFNFPRSIVFLGDAGSMFVGLCMAWIMWELSEGFMAADQVDLGASELAPAVLIMGVPLFDAAFVVIMRAVEGRPVYLGDDQHLSHRLVRGGFSPAEAVVVLWGLGLFLAGVGTFVVPFAEPAYRYLLFAAAFLVMTVFTLWVMGNERRHLAAARAKGNAGKGNA